MSVAAKVETLVELLEARAAASLGGYSFEPDGSTRPEMLDFPQLARQARAVAAQLQAQLAPSSRALLLYPPGLSFLPAFFGCLYAGVIAVPAPPPDGTRLKRSLPRLLSIVEDAEPDVILTTGAMRRELGMRIDALLPGWRWLATDEVGADDASWRPPALRAADIAYLQYTSGSTARPRGVMLTHANLLHNLEQIRRSLDYREDSRTVTWMPYFHDYGLVDGLLQPLYSNIPCQVMAPLSFLKRPWRWLQAIDRTGATHTHGPNFAYELCVERIAPHRREGLDLSRWRVAGNGAEPVRADTLRRFAEAFGPCGFRPSAFRPAYGMAEATLFITAGPHEDAGPRQAALATEGVSSVVSCGAPQPGTDLRIVDPESGQALGPGRIGEIWVDGPSVARGYWGKPDESAATFQARLAGDPAAGPFLRTGDLGFLRDGQLYPTGRLKELIIVAGANHYPHDIEWTVERRCPGVRPGHCVAFSVERDGEERLVILVEPDRPMQDWTKLLRQVGREVAEEHGLAVECAAVVRRGGILKTSSGKLQRRACRAAFLEERLDILGSWRAGEMVRAEVAAAASDRGRARLQAWLCDHLGGVLGMEARDIDPATPFAEYGIDSRRGMAMVAELESWLGTELDPAALWRHPTVATLSAFLSGDAQPAVPPQTTRAQPAEAVAVIGVACRFPQSPDIQAFWSLLRDGRSGIGSSPRLPGVEAGFLGDVESCDAGFFGLSAGEARAMDPQQRLLLEVAWEALEDAGLAPRHLAGSRCGVWTGISTGDFSQLLSGRPDAAELIGSFSGPGLAFCMAANRLSYLLDLRGPSMAIDTACSSSLVAVHQACRSLSGGETDLALVGGVNLILGPHVQLALDRAGMLSPDRRCKTFDAEADGYVRGEGCGVVVLKRLSDARRDGDTVLAVVRGSAVNQDGRSNGLTAPNPLAQQAVIREALDRAGLAPADVGYVETHGTGTRLGDPIEVASLLEVLSDGRPDARPCLLGSVKANIGHLEAAAGIAGFIKAVLVLRHGWIPPQLNLRRVNPLIKLDGASLAIAASGQEWLGSFPHRAGVSSFGFGGTNAHVVLEAAQPTLGGEAGAAVERPLHLLALSARDGPALRELAGRYAAWLDARPDVSVPDLCFTAATRRAHHPERLCVHAANPAELAGELRRFAAGKGIVAGASGRAGAQPLAIAFLFTGQGAQYAGMGRRLYETQPLVRSILDECDALLRDVLDRPLLDVMFGAAPGLIDQTAYAQPALFALGYALARLWQQWGVEPAAVLGHSVGEYTAACVAGVLGLEDGLRLVAARGKLMQGLPPGGAMLAVDAAENAMHDAIRGKDRSVAIAAANGPRSTVLSGDRRVLETLAAGFAEQGLGCRFLQVSHAFHSPLLDPILDEFRAVATRIDYAAPRVPWATNLDGQLRRTAPDAEYWTRQMRGTVRFADGLRELAAALPPQAGHVFLELGPRHSLGILGAQSLPEPDALWLPSLQPGRDDWATLLDGMACLYAAGVMPDWEAFDRDTPRRRLGGLPSYPFQRQPAGLPPLPGGRSMAAPVLLALQRDRRPAPDAILDLIGKGDAEALANRVARDGGLTPEARDGLLSCMRALVRQHRQEAWAGTPAEWLYRVEWEPRPAEGPVRFGPADAGTWLIIADAGELGARLHHLLQTAGVRSVVRRADSARLEAHGGEGWRGVVYLGALDAPLSQEASAEALLDAQAAGCGAALRLVQALAGQNDEAPPKLWLVTQGAVAAQAYGGPPQSLSFGQAALWGMARVIRLEHPDLWGGIVDLDPGTPARNQAEALMAELLEPCEDDEIAFRADGFRVPRLRAVSPAAAPAGVPVRADATYLVTGGLGALGVSTAEWLVSRGARNLVLAGRRAPNPAVRARVAGLERAGTRVSVVQADVSDGDSLAGVFGAIEAAMPPLRGVIHAAGVMDDGILLNQDMRRMSAVLAPKLAGAWNLHRLTRDMPLEFFVLFSSAAGVLGWPGQGSYAAANAFLDALACHRRAQGLAGLSVNWGAWAQTGLTAGLDAHHSARWDRLGLGSIPPELGLQALELAMQSGCPQVAVLPADWAVFARGTPARSRPRLLAELLPDQPEPDDSWPGSLLRGVPGFPPTAKPELAARVRGAAASERRAILVSHIRADIAAILGAGRTVDLDRGLFDMGFDSLAALELKNRLETATGQRLAATLAFDYPSIASLAEHLLHLLVPEMPVSRSGPADDRNDAALASIAALSDSELESLVDDELRRSST